MQTRKEIGLRLEFEQGLVKPAEPFGALDGQGQGFFRGQPCRYFRDIQVLSQM